MGSAICFQQLSIAHAEVDIQEKKITAYFSCISVNSALLLDIL